MKPTRHVLSVFLFASAWIACGQSRGEPTIDANSIIAPFEVTIDPEYPLKLRFEGLLEGHASAIVVVDRHGQLLDHLLIEASHVLFGEALMKVIPQWKFGPPTQNGQPVNVARRINVDFDSTGAIISTFGFDAFVQRHPSFAEMMRDPFRMQVVPPRQLDQVPSPVVRVDPVAPPARSLQGQAQRVIFSFFIDQSGRVRVPLALESPDHPVDERLLDSVHNALVQWQFTPPTLNGRPVLTQVRQPFEFLPRAPAPAVPQS